MSELAERDGPDDGAHERAGLRDSDRSPGSNRVEPNHGQVERAEPRPAGCERERYGEQQYGRPSQRQEPERDRAEDEHPADDVQLVTGAVVGPVADEDPAQQAA